ncbi:unnamed protein product [Ilex paraguariensis]|uniref:AB hydrolase-1 domain-containing protein n=1 Tax=Ilex paraguariensis TaxID=185542 RepID=A0ABC8UI34_9AQUA
MSFSIVVVTKIIVDVDPVLAGGDCEKCIKLPREYQLLQRSLTLQNPNQNISFHLLGGMFKKLTQVVLIGFLAWAYQTTLPLPPKVSGSPFGPSITPTSIKLRDGRHLAYKEHGVPKSMAKYEIVYIDDIGHSSHDLPIAIPELAEEFVSFDRPGYGKSDPDPTGAIESIVLDIEELADQLELVPKFYVIGFSMGGNMAWGCLKYVPHRLAGAALLAPAINYWLPGFPANLSALVNRQFP